MRAFALQGWWLRHRTRILQVALTLMMLAAPPRVEFGLSRLLGEHAPQGAIDLKLRYNELHNWFSGTTVYGKMRTAVYPPATYVMLWPFLGWLTVTSARWLWAALTVLMLGWLAYLIVRESCAETLLEGLVVGLLPFAMYATSVALGNGQLIVPLLPTLVAGLVLLHDRRQGGATQVLAAVLVLLTLASPTIAAPFFWLVMFALPTLWPAGLVLLGYGTLTFFAATFQGADPLSLFFLWHASAMRGACWGSVRGGYAY